MKIDSMFTSVGIIAVLILGVFANTAKFFSSIEITIFNVLLFLFLVGIVFISRLNKKYSS